MTRFGKNKSQTRCPRESNGQRIADFKVPCTCRLGIGCSHHQCIEGGYDLLQKNPSGVALLATCSRGGVYQRKPQLGVSCTKPCGPRQKLREMREHSSENDQIEGFAHVHQKTLTIPVLIDTCPDSVYYLLLVLKHRYPRTEEARESQTSCGLSWKRSASQLTDSTIHQQQWV